MAGHSLPNTMPLDTKLGDTVLDGTQLPRKMGHSIPHFSVRVYCTQTVGGLKILLGTKVDLGPGHIVLYPAPPSRKGHSSPLFSAHVYCVQTAGWIKMPVGTEVGLGPGQVVLDGNPCPSP